MYIFICIMFAVGIPSVAVFFYCLGLSHGRAVKDGSTVKFEPHRRIVRAVKQHKEKKEVERKQDEFTGQLQALFAYDGRLKKAVNK